MREPFGASALFGREKDAGLEGSLTAMLQTFGGKELYPGLEEKAATLGEIEAERFISLAVREPFD